MKKLEHQKQAEWNNNYNRKALQRVSRQIFQLLEWEREEVELDPDIWNPEKKEVLETLRQEIIGQEKAKQKLVDAVFDNINTIRPWKGPLWVFFFAWPTWVWKTQLAKSLAKALFGRENAITKIECQNYTQDHTQRDLFGAPKSYVWYGQPTPLADINLFNPFFEAKKQGTLSESLRKMTWGVSIIVFDEIEKAHFSIKQSLLSAMDDWQITLTCGKEDDKDLNFSKYTDLSNTIIIFTSNIWTQESDPVGFVRPENPEEQKYLNALQEEFSPEFIGRIDDFICFEELTQKDCKEIVKIHLQDINWHLQTLNFRAKLNVHEDVINYISNKWYSPETWARELERIINEEIEKRINNIINSWQLEWVEEFQQNNPGHYIEINFKIIDNKIKCTAKNQYEETRIQEKQQPSPETISGPDNQFSKWQLINTSIETYHLYEEYLSLFDFQIEDQNSPYRIEEIEEHFKSMWVWPKEINNLRKEWYKKLLKSLEHIQTYEWIQVLSSGERHCFRPFPIWALKTMIKRTLNKYDNEIQRDYDLLTDIIDDIIFDLELRWFEDWLSLQQKKVIIKLIDSIVKD